LGQLTNQGSCEMPQSESGDDADPFPAASVAEADFTDVEHTIGLFTQVASGPDFAWTLSTALCTLQSQSIDRQHPVPLRLPRGDRPRLIGAIERAYRVAWEAMPADYPRERITEGMRAAAELANCWASDRSRRKNDFVRDAVDRARCFRNDLHNMCLRQEIAERAQKRALERAASRLFVDGSGDGHGRHESPPPIAFVTVAPWCARQF